MGKLRKWIKYFLPAIAVLLLVGLVLSRVFQPERPGRDAGANYDPDVRITAHEAAAHIGKIAEVCGEVAGAVYARHVNGEPTFINLVRPHPDQPFTAVIWGEDRHKWRIPPERQYQGVDLCVSGELGLHEGTPQITVYSPEQITVR